MSFSSSVHHVATRTTNGIQDKYLQCAQTIAVRKFDPLVVNSASWNEVWIGFRWRLDPAYQWKRTTNKARDFTNHFDAMFGVCNTTGYVFGESGSTGTRSDLKHYAGFQLRNNSTDYPHFSHAVSASISQSMLRTTFVPNVYVTGSYAGGGNANLTTKQYAELPISAPSSSRNLMIMRMVTGSSATVWSVSILYPSGSSPFRDVSGSFRIADFFEAPNWNYLYNSVNALLSGSYMTTSFSNCLNIDRATNTYFDGAFFSWDRRFDYLEISDIVLRMF